MMPKRKRCSKFQSIIDEEEEPRSVLEIGVCISPPQQQQQQQQQQQHSHLLQHPPKKLILVKQNWDEELDVWAPLEGEIEAALKPPSSSQLHFPVWEPPPALEDEEFLLESSSSSGVQQNEDDAFDHWRSCHQQMLEVDSDKFLLEVCTPVLREDVLQHKIELQQQQQQQDFFDEWAPMATDSIAAAIAEEEEVMQASAAAAAAAAAAEEDASGGGIRLVQLLLACAEAVACRDVKQAALLLDQLHRMASPQGDSMQRVTSCFVDGLAARLAGLQQSMSCVGGGGGTGCRPVAAPPAARRVLLPDMLRNDGFRLVYELCPFIAFGHFAANAAILEAVEGEAVVHIVDLGMSSSLQWPALFQGLAARSGGPPRLVRLTGVSGERGGRERLEAIGTELSELASELDMGFEFRSVCAPVESLHKGMLDARPGEALAINSVFQLHCVVKESRRSLKSVLQSIHELNPKILTLVEQDACHNGPFFLGRFMEALHYYSAVFDSLDSILPVDSHERLKVERYYFGEEIKNIVACEGPDRVERHERADQWRRRMSRAGFQPKPLKFLSEAKTWMSMYYSSEGYTLAEEKGCIILGWKGKPIVAASTWRC